MEIRHLKLVKTVAETGSLTRASEQLFLSQSALSHQLKEIEAEIGTEVFYRINKKMVLSEVGKRVLESAKLVIHEIDKLSTDIHAFVNGEAGCIRLSTECYTCYHWLPPVLKQFNSVFPKIEISILPEATKKPISNLLAGKLDVAIVHDKVEHSSLIYEPLFEDELVLVVPNDHHLLQKHYVTALDLTDEVLLTYSSEYEEYYSFQKVFKPAGLFPRKVISLQLTGAIIEMIAAGLGVAILAKWLMQHYLDEKKVSYTTITKNGLYRSWYAVTLNSNFRPKHLDTIIAYIKEAKRGNFRS